MEISKKLLHLYVESGVDEVISETPINRLLPKISKEKSEKSTIQTNQNKFNNITTFDAISKLAQRKNDAVSNNTITNHSVSLEVGNQGFSDSPKTNQPIISMTEIIAKARKLAESANDLQELRKAVEDFDGCSLKRMATNTVFADGSPDSKIMIIGEAPGNHEDLQGIPFCGDSGKLLNEMFKAIGFKRDNLYITNTLFWRPPGNRRPTEDELSMCKPFVEKHIALMKPKLIVLMGATAMVDVLKINDPIGKARGKFYEYQNQYLTKPIKTTVLFHPSYLMRQSSKKRDSWLDLLMIKEFLEK